MDRDLLNYLPGYMRAYEEIKQITQAEQPTVASEWAACDSVLNEGSIQTETEYGIKTWEAILGISPLDTDTLDFRRFRIQGILNENLPYTEENFEKRLSALVGSDGYSIDFSKDNNLTMKILIALKSKAQLDAAKELAERIVPMNVCLNIDLKYNQNETLHAYTHEQLTAYTHEQLRSSILEV